MNFRVNEMPYKMARRTLNNLRRRHRNDFADADAFATADRSICPELWDAHQPEPQFGSTCCDLDDQLLVTVADAYGIDPVLFDDTLIAADYEEQRIMQHEAMNRALLNRPRLVTCRIVCDNPSIF